MSQRMIPENIYQLLMDVYLHNKKLTDDEERTVRCFFYDKEIAQSKRDLYLEGKKYPHGIIPNDVRNAILKQKMNERRGE